MLQTRILWKTFSHFFQITRVNLRKRDVWPRCLHIWQPSTVIASQTSNRRTWSTFAMCTVKFIKWPFNTRKVYLLLKANEISLNWQINLKRKGNIFGQLKVYVTVEIITVLLIFLVVWSSTFCLGLNISLIQVYVRWNNSNWEEILLDLSF